MVKKQKPTRLKDVFRGLQDQMEAKLTFTRGIVSHPGTKGTASELEWNEMLSTYLPRRYCNESAFVIDARGRISDQLDIVIFDRQYSPFLLKQNGIAYVPAECVYAIIEVKQSLSTTNIKYAQKKAASVRRLARTSVPIPHAGGEFPPKPPAHIVAGIVALDGRLSKGAQRLLVSASASERLDVGCSLVGRTFFSLRDMHPWKKMEPPHNLDHINDSNSLVRFFMVLVAELGKVGTVPAIDIKAYLD